MTNKKYFPIVNDAACLYKWAWSTIFLSRGTTTSCHRGYHWRINENNFMDFHNHPGKLSDREKMINGDWPSNGCEYCRDVEKAGGKSDRLSFVNHSTELLPPEMENLVVKAFEYDNIPTSVSPTLLEIYFNNVCNQACVYCTPGFSSVIEQEVRQFGPSEFNSSYSNWRPDTKYELYKEKFWEWMKKYSHNLQILQVLGGEPLYQKEFDQCLDFFETHPNPNLVWRIFTNLKHPTEKFQIKIDRIQKLVNDKKIKQMEFVCSIDCWGPEIEYVRDGIVLEEWEKNMNIILENPSIGVLIHATLTSLTLPTLYQLIDKTIEWRSKYLHKYVGINWNTVVSPDCFNPYYFGHHLVPFVDRAISSCLNVPFLNQGKEHLEGIKQQLLATPVNKEKVNQLVGFINDLDKRRNRDWKAVFPQILNIVDKIQKE